MGYLSGDCLHQSPSDDSWPAIGEELEVEELTKSRVQFDAHVHIVENGSCLCEQHSILFKTSLTTELSVSFMSRTQMSFEVDKP